MKNSLTKCLKMLLILFGAMIVGAILLILVFYIPTANIKKNVRTSAYQISVLPQYNQFVQGYTTSYYDSFTDSLMLINAMYEKEDTNVIDRAMDIYYFYFKDGDTYKYPWETLQEWSLNDLSSEYDVFDYARYWHGYLVFLKPLLTFFTYSDIRMINMFLQMLLVGILIHILSKKKQGGFLIPLALSYFILNPISLMMTMQFSDIFYISIVTMILIAYKYEKIFEKKTLVYYFFVAGICTSYFDYLTYPLLTYAFPMCLVLYIKRNESWWNICKYTICCGLTWCIGYGGMWTGKWLVGSILTGKNMFAMAYGALRARTSMESGTETFNIIDVYKGNLAVLNKPIIIIVLTVVFVALIILMIKKHLKSNSKFSLQECKKGLIFIGIAMIPFVWYTFASNHSYVHTWMTYRELSITICSLATWIICFLHNEEKEIEE